MRLVVREQQQPDACGYALMIDRKPNGARLFTLGQDDVDFVVREERVHQSKIPKRGEAAPLTRLVGAGGERQCEMCDPRKNGLTLEMTVEAPAARLDLEPG